MWENPRGRKNATGERVTVERPRSLPFEGASLARSAALEERRSFSISHSRNADRVAFSCRAQEWKTRNALDGDIFFDRLTDVETMKDLLGQNSLTDSASLVDSDSQWRCVEKTWCSLFPRGQRTAMNLQQCDSRGSAAPFFVAGGCPEQPRRAGRSHLALEGCG